MIHQRSLFHRAAGVLTLAMTVVLAWPTSWVAAQETQVASSASGRDWREALAHFSKGDFEAGRTALAPLLELQPAAKRVNDWTQSFLELQEQRKAMNQADYEKYVRYSQHALSEKEMAIALGFAQLAMRNSEDEVQFRGESWLQGLVTESLKAADEFRLAGKWREAAEIYDQLCEIFEQNADYQRLRRECLTHFRLQYVYKKDGNWSEYLRGITAEMGINALYYIDREYVETADFRKLTLGGLNQLLLLVASPGLGEVFAGLKDDLDREEFVKRVEKRKLMVSDSNAVARRNAADELTQVLKINRETIKLPEELLVSEYMLAALEELDEFTSIFWPAEFTEFTKHTDGEFVGVGISISKPLDEIVVATPLPNTPAYRAGILPGDVIAAIDGKTTEGLALTEAVRTITGPKGTQVTLTIKRKDAAGQVETMEIPLIRQQITLDTVKGFAKDPNDELKWNFLLDPEMGIGYIRVENFSKRTVSDMRQTIADLQKHNLKALIVDLRNDPGGLLTAAQEMADLFLNKGDLIVKTEGLRSEPMELRGESSNDFETLPLTVLINESSASASEIVAGALRDHGRAVLVGDRTFGKFSVQNLQPLPGGDAALKYTTAWYYLPSGANLHRREGATTWGVEPHVKIPVVPKEAWRIRELFWKMDRLGPEAPKVEAVAQGTSGVSATGEPTAAPESGSTGTPPTPVDGATPTDPTPETEKAKFSYDDENDRPEVDPQLQAALLITRVRLLELDQTMMASSHEAGKGVVTE